MKKHPALLTKNKKRVRPSTKKRRKKRALEIKRRPIQLVKKPKLLLMKLLKLLNRSHNQLMRLAAVHNRSLKEQVKPRMKK